MKRRVEVLVAGAGPAGATAALNLAPYRSVMLVDFVPDPIRRIGESLLPAARQLLTDMGLFTSFEKLGMLPWYANRSVWGTSLCVETDFLRDPNGHGWHIDRARFENFLRAAAMERGACLLSPARIDNVRRSGQRFEVTLQMNGGPVVVESDFLIDAGGRRAPFALRLEAKRCVDLPLLCTAVYGSVRDAGIGAGITFTEAVEDGWWYTAPVPGGQRILAFHTDSDNPAAASARSRDGLLAKAGHTTELCRMLTALGFEAETRCFGCAASGSLLNPCGGPGWMATGDAALTFDPLSSQGLLNALFLGLACAEATDSYLSGQTSVATEYQRTVTRIRESYCGGLRHSYGQGQRWPNSPFWRRRHAEPARG